MIVKRADGSLYGSSDLIVDRTVEFRGKFVDDNVFVIEAVPGNVGQCRRIVAGEFVRVAEHVEIGNVRWLGEGRDDERRSVVRGYRSDGLAESGLDHVQIDGAGGVVHLMDFGLAAIDLADPVVGQVDVETPVVSAGDLSRGDAVR